MMGETQIPDSLLNGLIACYYCPYSMLWNCVPPRSWFAHDDPAPTTTANDKTKQTTINQTTTKTNTNNNDDKPPNNEHNNANAKRSMWQPQPATTQPQPLKRTANPQPLNQKGSEKDCWAFVWTVNKIVVFVFFLLSNVVVSQNFSFFSWMQEKSNEKFVKFVKSFIVIETRGSWLCHSNLFSRCPST